MSVSVGGGSIWLFSSGAAIDFAGCGTIGSGAAGCGGGAQAGANLRADGRVVRARSAEWKGARRLDRKSTLMKSFCEFTGCTVCVHVKEGPTSRMHAFRRRTYRVF
jgi:hypothetical protein